MFRWNSYWGNWSRVLFSGDWFVEISLTPVRDWEEIGQEKIRVHGTLPGKKDRTVNTLPEAILLEMKKNLSAEVVDRLTTYDYMSELPPVKELLSKMRGGGVPFAELKVVSR
jgi:hypothetical protein